MPGLTFHVLLARSFGSCPLRTIWMVTNCNHFYDVLKCIKILLKIQLDIPFNKNINLILSKTCQFLFSLKIVQHVFNWNTNYD